ncbi:MAG: hypothetical protein HKL96_14100 [Phycisphaerales bacterium]|nr:hypothetical protein [Phycisphaerales bacterium]
MIFTTPSAAQPHEPAPLAAPFAWPRLLRPIAVLCLLVIGMGMAACSQTSSSSAAQRKTLPHRRVYTICFYGLAGHNPTRTFGNEWLQTLAVHAQAHLYRWDQPLEALSDLLTRLDAHANHNITRRELAGVTIRVIGYSWGAITAANFVQMLNRCAYATTSGWKAAEPIPVALLITLDPVNFVHTTTGVSANVKTYINYYEDRGGYSHMRCSWPEVNRTLVLGNNFDALLSGDYLPSKAQGTHEIDVDKKWATRKVYMRFTPPDFPTTPHGVNVAVSLAGDQVNHDTLPWFVYRNVLRDLNACN